MQYSKTFIFVGLWSAVTLSCAQSQQNTAPVSAMEIQNSKGEADQSKNVVNPKAVEDYWTKEKMEKAKPMPTPTVIIDPKAPETSSDVQPHEQDIPGGEAGQQ